MHHSSQTATIAGRSRFMHYRRTALTALLSGAMLLAPAATWALPARAPLAQSDAQGQATGTQVIAQGIARLPKESLAWVISQADVPGGEGAAVAKFPTGFALTADGSVAVLDEEGGTLSILDRGEAVFMPSGKAGSLKSFRGDTASLYTILLVSGEDVAAGSLPGTVVGEAFAVPPGKAAEVELARGVLGNGATAFVPASRSQTPSLFMVTGGTVQVQAPDGTVAELAAGQFALLVGEVTVIGTGDVPTEFIVASIGDEATVAAGDKTADGSAKKAKGNTGGQATGQASGGKANKAPKAQNTGGSGTGGGTGTGTTTDKPAKDKKDKKEKPPKDGTPVPAPVDGTPAPLPPAASPSPETQPQETTPATPTPEVDQTDTVDQDDTIVEQDDTVVVEQDPIDETDTGDTQIVVTPETPEATVPEETVPEETVPEETVPEEPAADQPVVEQSGEESAPVEAEQAAPVVEQPAEEAIVEQEVPAEIVVEEPAPELVQEPAPAEGDASTDPNAAP